MGRVTTSEAQQPSANESYERPSRLGQIAAWVGIVAGVVFVTAVIFFSGVALAMSTYEGGWPHRDWVDDADGNAGRCPMMNPGGMMPPGGPRSVGPPGR
ncbi:hypothetical protein BST30_07500 [Mycobacterium mantenii]|uniref:Uncharacterized protein n=1 Tax=Mycobacterium mantenii TaxID=560555 RepID=A0A1X0G0V8_MYCNT|nr:hypothetical protein BST30_07500 [Mycobacterium mantenii]